MLGEFWVFHHDWQWLQCNYVQNIKSWLAYCTIYWMQAADCVYCIYSALFCLVHIMLCDYKGTKHMTWNSSPCCHPVILFPQLRIANLQLLVRLLQWPLLLLRLSYNKCAGSHLGNGNGVYCSSPWPPLLASTIINSMCDIMHIIC